MNMNSRNLFIVFLLVIPVFLITESCASKRNTNKAVKFEEAGLFKDAAEYYYEAVKRKSSNVDAKLGLRKTGQQTLDEKLKKVKNAYKQVDYEEVVYHYRDAKNFFNKVASVGVHLTLPDIYESYYDEAKNDFLNTRYREGIDKLEREEFKAALKVFQEIKSVDPAYKDVSDKYTIAKFEPVYRDANIYFENELYRKAYYAYEEILREAGNYKQALTLKNEARKKGTINIMISGLEYSHQSYKHYADIITSGLNSRMLELNDPFISIIDEESVKDRIYKNGKVDLHAASLVGIKAILNGKILTVRKNTGKLNKENKRGYLKTYIKKKNSEGEEYSVPEYKKTEYAQYKASNSAELQISFSLVSTDNSKVIVSDLIKMNNTDQVEYVKFNGDKNKLIPGYWKSKSYRSDQDIIKDNSSDVNALRSLVDANQKAKPVSALLDELLDQSIDQIVYKIDDYNPER